LFKEEPLNKEFKKRKFVLLQELDKDILSLIGFDFSNSVVKSSSSGKKEESGRISLDNFLIILFSENLNSVEFSQYKLKNFSKNKDLLLLEK
jgi:hypothetical protein